MYLLFRIKYRINFNKNIRFFILLVENLKKVLDYFEYVIRVQNYVVNIIT